MSENDVKQFLYAWLGRNKYEAPNYDVREESTRDGRKRFKCVLTVNGFSYSAFGNSTSKKNASTNAANDFCQFLVRDGKLNENEIPTFQQTSLEQSSDFVPMNSNFGSMMAGSVGGNRFLAKNEWGNAYRKNNSHEEYIKQKAEEILASENVDMKSEIHGGWSLENSKKALNEFLQKTRQPPVSYKTVRKESNFSQSFEATTTIYVPQLRKTLSGHGTATTKKVAESTCAMNIVRQMFHMNIMQEYSGPQKKSKTSNLPEINIDITSELSEKVKAYVNTCGINLKNVNEGIATPDQPVSLLSDQVLDSFPDSKKVPPLVVSWAPPMQNWNPWNASNIDEEPLAFMSIVQINQFLGEYEMTKQQSEGYHEAIEARQQLPIWKLQQKIVETVKNNRITLIKGQTGCGKSTQVVQFLLDDYIGRGKTGEFSALVSQPRRISAISLAARIANERCEELGQTVGYSVRFDCIHPRPYGSIMFCTVGVLLRMMENGLRGISHIIIDEIHERDVDTDLILIVLRDMLCEHPHLRVIIMSATIDTTLFTKFFEERSSVIGNCPALEAEGRTFPVDAFFLEDILLNLEYMPDEPLKKKSRNNDDQLGDDVVDKAKNMNILDDPEAPPKLKLALSRIEENRIPFDVITVVLMDISKRDIEGAVLIFLPGWAEIMSYMNSLEEHSEFSQKSKYVILPLHSQLTSAEQKKVFNHYEGQRKIILSTNIAETSITIDDVVFVIDSCKAKEKLYTTNNNMVHFATVWASKTNIVQRRGRAGRVTAGFAFHLCSKKRFEALDEHSTAEILRTPLHQTALTIKLLQLGSVGEFLGKALEPPSYDAVVESEAVLKSIGALDSNFELTSLGKMIARIPTDPLIGKSFILGAALGLGSVMCDLVSAMSFSSPFIPREKHHSRLSRVQRKLCGRHHSDHMALINVTQKYRETREAGSLTAEQDFCEFYSLSHPILKMTFGARRQLYDALNNQCRFSQDLLEEIPVNVNGTDSNLDIIKSLLVMCLYPNACYHMGKRNVLTLDESKALIKKNSSIMPLEKNADVNIPSPFIIFTEKVRSNCISCNSLTVISVVQLMVFGCRKIECIGEGLVRLDEMFTLKMKVEDAIALAALRPCIEAFLVRACEHPEAFPSSDVKDAELRQILREVSSESFMTTAEPLKDNLLTDEAKKSGGSAKPNFGRNMLTTGDNPMIGKMTSPSRGYRSAPYPPTNRGYNNWNNTYQNPPQPAQQPYPQEQQQPYQPTYNAGRGMRGSFRPRGSWAPRGGRGGRGGRGRGTFW